MEDILLIKYLKEKNLISDDEYYSLISKIDTPAESDTYSEFFDKFRKVTESMNPADKEKFVESLKYYGNSSDEHFNESYAKYVVSSMYHTDNEKKCIGEKYNMVKAKEIHEKYRSHIPAGTTDADVYVAVNAHYHNYYNLFKTWFGINPDNKIIEASIVYWFADEDYTGISKVWKAFN